MNIVGWAIVALMIVTLWRNLTRPQNATETSRKNGALVTAIITINLMSVLDALSTIYLVSNNHSVEANPVMKPLLDQSFVLFFVVKMAITLSATMICWHYYDRKRRARSILRVTSRVYSLLLAWHCLLLSSVLI